MEQKNTSGTNIAGDFINQDKVLGDKITNIYLNTKDFQELESQLIKLQTKKTELRKQIAKNPDVDYFNGSSPNFFKKNVAIHLTHSQI